MGKQKVLVLENDFEISERLSDYLKDQGLKPKLLVAVPNRTSEEIAEEFGKAEVLIIEPNLISFSQYNLMLMLMYDLMTKEKLAIKEVRIFTGNEDIEEDLKELWESKTKYLAQVLEKVKIFSVDKAREYEKVELKLI